MSKADQQTNNAQQMDGTNKNDSRDRFAVGVCEEKASFWILWHGILLWPCQDSFPTFTSDGTDLAFNSNHSTNETDSLGISADFLHLSTVSSSHCQLASYNSGKFANDSSNLLVTTIWVFKTICLTFYGELVGLTKVAMSVRPTDLYISAILGRTSLQLAPVSAAVSRR